MVPYCVCAFEFAVNYCFQDKKENNKNEREKFSYDDREMNDREKLLLLLGY